MSGTIRVSAGVVCHRLAARRVAADAKPPLAGRAVDEPAELHLRGELPVLREVGSPHGVGSLEELPGDDRRVEVLDHTRLAPRAVLDTDLPEIGAVGEQRTDARFRQRLAAVDADRALLAQEPRELADVVTSRAPFEDLLHELGLAL